MKRALAAIAGLSLLGSAAYADDAKAETKTEVHRNADGTGSSKTVTTRKHSTRHGVVKNTATDEHKVSKDMGGGTTEKREVTSDHPGGKTVQSETVKRDSHGRVIKHEKKAEAK
jgi:hypothetical protein